MITQHSEHTQNSIAVHKLVKKFNKCSGGTIMIKGKLINCQTTCNHTWYNLTVKLHATILDITLLKVTVLFILIFVSTVIFANNRFCVGICCDWQNDKITVYEILLFCHFVNHNKFKWQHPSHDYHHFVKLVPVKPLWMSFMPKRK